jgi:hypothetical protein
MKSNFKQLSSCRRVWGCLAAGIVFSNTTDALAQLLYTCPLEPMPGTPILSIKGACGGGMAGNGWDGSGQNSATVFWHVEGTTPDFGAAQRTALINAMNAWAGVVQITFQELPIANANQSIDFNFLTGNHSASEPQEAGDADCPFDGAGGVLAHAGFPVGVNSTCPGILAETFAGNVHFDEAEAWEQDTGGAAAFSLTLIACHEIGHAIGLVHATAGWTDVMRPSFSPNDGFVGLNANDIANARIGYAMGAGQVRTLNDSGVWVNKAFVGTERGTQAAPFNTVTEGVKVVHIQSGTYNEAMTISRNMELRAENGSVTIGQ